VATFFYEKVIKVKADVAALRIVFFSDITVISWGRSETAGS